MAGKKLTQQQAYRLGTDYQFIDSIALGPWTSYSLLHDPKHMTFVLARYKFCAKMLEGLKDVMEVGCGDAFGTPIVAQAVGHLLAIDPEIRLIKGNQKRLGQIKNIDFKQMDICRQLPERTFDAIFSLDVIEHLDRPLNLPFMKNQCAILKKDGVCIIGTPNITANRYASPRGRIEHINLMSQQTLRARMGKFFKNVFIFGMNDEIVHTGYAPMCHYTFGMGVGVR